MPHLFIIPSRNLLRVGYSIAAVRVFIYVCVSIVSSLAKFQENPQMNIHQTLYTSLAC